MSVITLGVADLGTARAFYEALGWRASPVGGDGVVFFQLGAMVLALYPRALLAEDADVADSEPAFSGVTLAYNVRDRAGVAEVLAEAERAGATILKPAQDAFWGGHHGYFADPDGHAWEVAWNPNWPIGPDGAVRLPG